MPGDLSIVGKEFQVLDARMKKERWVSRFNKYINEHSSVMIHSNSTTFCTQILHDKTHQKTFLILLPR